MDQTQSLSPEDYFSVTYSITPPPGISPEAVAQGIAEEQTVEIPHESIPDCLFESGIVGTVDSIVAGNGGAFRAVIRYRNDITGFSLPQFLNVLFGNISLKRSVRIVNLNLPAKLTTSFGGPQRGIDGIRQLIGVYRRPLLSTALKPMGISCAQLSRIAGSCARGGIDIIKDDHGIADQHFHPFEERVGRVAEAIAAANAATGKMTLYFPNICGPVDTIEHQVQCAIRNGIQGVLCAPQLVGFDMVRYLGQKYRIMIMAHPAFTGSLFTTADHGITPALFLGTLFRLFGADISVFPSWGGRFPFTREECIGIAAALTSEMLPLRRAFPAPAGGMQLARLEEISGAYGEEAILLIGGALLGRSADPYSSTAAFLDEIRRYFDEDLRPPEQPFGSSCEYRPEGSGTAVTNDFLKFDDFNWNNRRRTLYKQNGSADFAGIDRIELIGRSGTQTGFDLRYFEIGPGGYSSFEKHLHEHVIIGVRGNGIVLKGGRRLTLCPHDIVYIGPLEPHQLRNEGDEPFGFYCIVDHERDRPLPAAPGA